MKKILRKKPIPGYIRVERRLLVAEPSEDDSGYSWTLAAALGEMLLHTEEMFGPRDTAYTILGIDFAPDGSKTWSPGNCGHVIIQLDMNALRDRHDAYRQLAHECVHVISPTGKADANVLEEGLAMLFEHHYMHYVFGEGWWSEPFDFPSYSNALTLARELFSLDSNIIKKVRQIQPIIAYITAEQIRDQCPAATKELAVALTQRFVR